MKTELTIPDHLQIATHEIDTLRNNVLVASKSSFESVIIRSGAIVQMRNLITDEIMQNNVMPLMGSRLGFKVDKQYPINVVKDCLIEATLSGVNAVGNQFNIISGNMYITKEGFTYLLKQIPNLKYTITYPNISFSTDKSTAEATCLVKWSINGVEEQETLTFTIKAGSYATADAIMGKAERKSKCWLYNNLTGADLTDGDIQDLGYANEVKVLNRGQILQLTNKIKSANTIEGLKSIYEHILKSENAELQELYNKRESQIVDWVISQCSTSEMLDNLQNELPAPDLYVDKIYKKRLELN